MEIKNTLNGGYNSVSIKTKDKLTRYDLDGKPHYEKTSKKIIDTPHKIEYTKHINPHFEQEGGGTQIKLPISIENLIQLDFIKQIP
ncbi:hypothetical protein CNU85_09215 [Campylobacter jejuni]|nr:hypothetical protein [Campylobacter jejuni]